MDDSELRLDELIDSADLRQRLSALAAPRDGDGSSMAVRSEVLKTLKQVSSEGRARAERMLFDDGSGTLCATRLSRLQDELIRVIYDFAVTHVYRSTNPSAAEQIAIVAVGGYGRGTLAPGSDIDLLFVLPYKQTAWGEAVVEYILYMLWDMGFKIGHATRTIDDCIRLSKSDMTIRTSVLEARFLWGRRELFDDLIARFDKKIVKSTAKAFIAAKLEERDQRHSKTGQSRYLVEPNVKDGKGGLRDLHTLFWIAKYFYRVSEPAQLVEAGLFNAREFDRFARAEDFLWTVRCHMHFLTGKAEERLSFDIQREMAERLKYVSHGGLQDVERFMKHYFLVAKEVGDLTLIVCSQLEEQQAKAVYGINGLIGTITRRRRKIKGAADFINDNGRINVADDEVFAADPVNLIRMFAIADEHNLDFHPDAIQLARRSLGLIDRSVRRDPQANRLFLDILSSRNGPEIVLRKMNETGVLGKFIPAFRRVVAMMQFNMYHHFTVDEHLLRSVGELARLEAGELSEQHPLSWNLFPEIEDRLILYVTMLLHDIAKGRREDHSIVGARIARQLCPRFGLNEEQTELVSWLVLEHLTMSNIAQSRDLNDRRTIADFANIVQTVDRMRYLLILTVCDIRAVGPGVWNGWKGQLLRTLYYETEPLLTGGFSKLDRAQSVVRAKEELAASLVGWEAHEIERVLALPYSAYFLSTEPYSQARHMCLIRDADAAGERVATTVHTAKFEAITEITILTPDHSRLLSLIAGACASAGADIVGARIHTTSDGRALDTIFVRRELEDDVEELRRGEAIGQSIAGLLSSDAPASSPARQLHRIRRDAKAFRVAAKVTIDNDLSDKFSVIEIEGMDRPGLLCALTDALADLGLDIGSAHIATFGEKANDSFYVTEVAGGKIETKRRRDKIRATLLRVLDPDGTKQDGRKTAAETALSGKSQREPA